MHGNCAIAACTPAEIEQKPLTNALDVLVAGVFKKLKRKIDSFVVNVGQHFLGHKRLLFGTSIMGAAVEFAALSVMVLSMGFAA